MAQERGAFVTLNEHGELRGCIGYVSPMKPLGETVREVAMFAALKDTRFQPGHRRPSWDRWSTRFGALPHAARDGREGNPRGHARPAHPQGDAEGLLLPQVPVEQKWDRAEFLEQVCLKAGLPPHAWQDPGADLFRFTALVFGEHRAPEPAIPGADVPATRTDAAWPAAQAHQGHKPGGAAKPNTGMR